MEAGRLAVHAYVDDCLEPDERLAFEQQWRRIRPSARAALWRARNSAIRTAFDTEGARAFPISIVRHQTRPLAGVRGPAWPAHNPSGEQPPRATWSAVAESRRPSAKILASDAFRRSLLWRVGVATLTVCLALVGFRRRQPSPANGLAEPALRLSRLPPDRGVEPVGSRPATGRERRASSTTRLARPVYLPATPSALKLMERGSRLTLAPGGVSGHKAQDRAVGLLVRSLDAPPTTAPQLLAADGGAAAVWIWRGQGLALVGDLDGAALLKIAADFADLPAEAAQPMPERGW